MQNLTVARDESVATITLHRGKVNALNEAMVEQLHRCFTDIQDDREIKVVILTGQGKFFSFGFDIPEFFSYSVDEFERYLVKFTDFYTYLFLFPKPVIAALNGHAIAGGCMLATCCDYRIMVSGKAKISLNEIGFGSSVFAGSVEMLKFCVGQRNAEKVLYCGNMYSAEEAMKLGLIDQITADENLAKDTRVVAMDFLNKDGTAFSSMKKLLRKPVQENMIAREKVSIQEFIDIWYSETTREQLKQIKIYS